MPVTRLAPRVEGVCIGWLTAFVDRDGVTFNEAVRFWLAATGSTLSTPRGDHTEFATLVPFDGDAYLRVQRVDVGGGSHMDLHVDNVEAFVGSHRCRGVPALDGNGGPIGLSLLPYQSRPKTGSLS